MFFAERAWRCTHTMRCLITFSVRFSHPMRFWVKPNHVTNLVRSQKQSLKVDWNLMSVWFSIDSLLRIVKSQGRFRCKIILNRFYLKSIVELCRMTSSTIDSYRLPEQVVWKSDKKMESCDRIFCYTRLLRFVSNCKIITSEY